MGSHVRVWHTPRAWRSPCLPLPPPASNKCLTSPGDGQLLARPWSSRALLDCWRERPQAEPHWGAPAGSGEAPAPLTGERISNSGVFAEQSSRQQSRAHHWVTHENEFHRHGA